MVEVIWRGLITRKARAVLTALAVVLGVAMISGTFVLIDTVMSAYSQIFRTAYVHTDAVVTAKSPFGAIGTTKPALPAGLISQIRQLPEVARAHGYIDDHAQLTDSDGKPFGKSSQEASLFGTPTGELDAMNPLSLVSGTWPSGPGQLIVDQSTANANHLTVGSPVGLVTRSPLEHYHVVGVFRFAGAVSLGPTQFVAVDLLVAQRTFDKAGLVDEIDVAARPSASVTSLISAIDGIAPPTAKVVTAADQARTATADVGKQFSLLRYALFAFAAIALFVGAFLIFNTMSITVTQRTAELATLRTLGASRAQVLGSVLGEGAVIGMAASVVGLGLGFGFAKALDTLFAASGVHLPSAGTVVAWRTVAVSLAAGVAITAAASLGPALRAMRTPAILAIRQTNPPGGAPRAAVAAVLVASSVGMLAPATVMSGAATTTRLLLLAGGALVLFTGIAVASRWAMSAMATAIAAPFRPFNRVVVELARDDTAHNPARTATTAAALTVAVALIAFVAMIGQGVRQATGNSIRSQVSADYVITPLRDVLSPQVQQTLHNQGITSAGVRASTVHVLGANQTMSGVTAGDIAPFWHFHWAKGSGPASVSSLGTTGVLVANDLARAHHLAVGSRLAAQTPSGVTIHLVVRGVYQSSRLDPLLGALTITTSLFDRSFTTPGDRQIYVNLPSQTAAAAHATLAAILKPFTSARINTLNRFVTNQQAPLATLLNMSYVLLALSVIISLIGMINTLTLSVSERTREIGMLRAIGMTRRQLQGMIRLESEIIAVIGATVGIAIGLLLAALTTRTLSGWNLNLTVPWTTLAIVVIIAVAAGTLAGVPPARRAGRLDPLTALSYE